MLCKNCNARPVCIIYKDIKKHTDIATIDVEECVHHNHNGMIEAQPILKPAPGLIAAGVVEADHLSKVNMPDMTMPKVYRDFNAKPEVITKTKLESHICEFCESDALSTYVCKDCGTKICEGCENVDVITNKKYCDFCWEKQ